MSNKNYIGSQQHWEDSINEDYDRQEQYKKDMEKEMEPQQEQPYPIEYYQHEVLNLSNVIADLTRQNAEQAERIKELNNFSKLKIDEYWSVRGILTNTELRITQLEKELREAKDLLLNTYKT